ncbi:MULTISPECIES: TonB-dependent receptor domain-containing protein [Empedobacter]|uniref:TonB-dependent receptor domain-containing protein n=1 Tax=Empedobacter TaxID=59734 RepID=UPI002577589A|nr:MULTISPECIES: TonB-dependent receptor [Empedobacter]MDM1041711.1 TonB-dependent receptor [Empedobacter brevis]MDM1135155.1 TonB-dependent receptor [Empedobacter sp. R750]
MFFIGLQQLCHQTNTNYTIAMKRNLTLLLLLGSAALFAQTNIKLEGTLFDQKTNQPLSEKTFVVEGLNIQAKTDDKGHYEISVPDDTYQLDIKVDGYQSVSQNLSDSNTLNMYLKPEDLKDTKIDLSTAVVTGRKDKSGEASLLNIQKKSVKMVENIGAAELDRKGVSDAASAVAKMAGVTKQEGTGDVFVRGLGDRYNYTSLNGLPIPSENPSNKNVKLDLFPTDVIDYISLSKTFNVRMMADFGGANIDIESKLYEGNGLLEIGTGLNLNSNAITNKNFNLQDGPNWFGFQKTKIPANATTGYHFTNSFNPQSKSAVAGGFNIKGGKSYKFENGAKFGFFATAAFDNSAQSIEKGLARSVDAQGNNLKGFNDYTKDSYNTNTTGMVNLYYDFNPNNRLRANSIFINNTSQSLQEYKGFIRDLAEDNNGFIRRGTYERNQVFVNQLLGDHRLDDKSEFHWGVSYNTVKQDMPDRLQNTMRLDKQSGQYVLASQDASLSNRYYQNLNENEVSANLEYNRVFGGDLKDYKAKISIGYQGRHKERDFEANQFNFKILRSGIQVDPNNLDAFFNQSNYGSGFEITTFDIKSDGSYRSQVYSGQKDIQVGFAEVEYNFTDRLTAVLGVRAEYLKQSIDWYTALSQGKNSFDQFELLPSLMLRYKLTDNQNLRFATSKTYTLPQFKETAMFVYEDVTETFRGNPMLYPSTNYNADIKWEWFPKSGEVISLGGFGKYIQDPINTTTIASSSNDISYANTGDWGYAVGAELEVRKAILDNKISNPEQLTVGFNGAYMYSNQELNNEKVYKETLFNGQRINTNFTNAEDAFTGASKFITNADLSYSKKWASGGSVMATVAYNYFSDRIYALGTETRGNQVDKGFSTLDFILRSKLNKNIGINFSAKNLLNPTIDRVQENLNGDVKTLSYKKGMNFGLSVNYQF